MNLRTHTLDSEPGQYIESLIYYSDFEPDHSIERVVPTGNSYLIFELDGFVRNTFNNETLKPNASFTNVWFSGMHRNYISISAHQKSEMFVVQFKPYGAHPFVYMPMQDLNDSVVPAEQLFGSEIFNLRDSLLNGSTPEKKFQIAEAWLNDVYDRKKTPPEELLDVVHRLQRESVTNYGTIVGDYPKTHKHLIAQFKKYVGLTPKYYQRIMRFNEILQLIHRSKKIQWSQVAYQCEYSDQSHFIKEFKHFSGLNPQKFIAHDFNQEGENFFPLDRKG
ncbi:MAG: DUF6597 domain-containing transcriptional factor [Saonia sp.]